MKLSRDSFVFAMIYSSSKFCWSTEPFKAAGRLRLGGSVLDRIVAEA